MTDEERFNLASLTFGEGDAPPDPKMLREASIEDIHHRIFGLARLELAVRDYLRGPGPLETEESKRADLQQAWEAAVSDREPGE